MNADKIAKNAYAPKRKYQLLAEWMDLSWARDIV